MTADGYRPGPHDDIVRDLADRARTLHFDVAPNDYRGVIDGKPRWCDLRLHYFGHHVLVEVKTDLSWAYLTRRADAQLATYRAGLRRVDDVDLDLVIVAPEIPDRARRADTSAQPLTVDEFKAWLVDLHERLMGRPEPTVPSFGEALDATHALLRQVAS